MGGSIHYRSRRPTHCSGVGMKMSYILVGRTFCTQALRASLNTWCDGGPYNLNMGLIRHQFGTGGSASSLMLQDRLHGRIVFDPPPPFPHPALGVAEGVDHQLSSTIHQQFPCPPVLPGGGVVGFGPLFVDVGPHPGWVGVRACILHRRPLLGR